MRNHFYDIPKEDKIIIGQFKINRGDNMRILRK